MIICIEGITNSGKSSICEIIQQRHNIVLANKLQKQSIVAQQIKAITGPVENIEAFDSNTELLLYSTLLSTKSDVIKSLQGNILLDRFSLSVYAYFKSRYQIDDSILEPIVKYSSRGIIPDVTFFLDVSLDQIMRRAVNSPFTRKDLGLEEYYDQLRGCYIDNINSFSKTSHIIDCNNISIMDTYCKICKYLDWR